MKKRILSLLLVVSLLLSGSALAASSTTEHFVRSKTYTRQFSDLSEESVFYPNVAALYEYGLSLGKADGTYGLQDSIGVDELVIFAARIRSLYVFGDAEKGPAGIRLEDYSFYMPSLPYLAYLQAEGVLGREFDGACAGRTPATRAQVAHVLARVLPAEALPPVHKDVVTECYASRQFVRDVTEYTPYFQDILTLYQCGVSVGSDARGTFWPDAAITRGAAAAMLTRLVDPALRLTPQWSISPAYNSAFGTTLASLVPQGVYLPAPTTPEEIEAVVRDMLSRGRDTIRLKYARATEKSVQDLMTQVLIAVKKYCEQCYNFVSCTYISTGEVDLKFEVSGGNTHASAYRDATMAAAISVHDQLWADGTLHSEMTEYEKARVYYTWICEHCVYDYNADTNSLSHIPYSLFHNGRAVCDGYTGAYNLLLKLEGIQCAGLSNSAHIWTVATLDGTEYHIDTTWGDSESTVSYAYFGMTAEQSKLYHSW